jgi:octanoyl-[GcvH]:protein N-octanoyltransferase
MTALHLGAPPDAALDVAISHALLEQATRGVESLRVWTPPPALSFGRLDLLSPRIQAAIAAARAAGLEPVRRLAGGRAAAIGPGTVCVGWAYPSPEMTGMQDRYETVAGLVVSALARAGVQAWVGELPGEWCPGSWSVLAGGAKAGGLAQRVVRGAAWAEAVIVVAGARALADALGRVQAALGVEWDADTLSDLPGTTPAQLSAALVAELEARHHPRRAPLPPEILDRAAQLRAEHAA